MRRIKGLLGLMVCILILAVSCTKPAPLPHEKEIVEIRLLLDEYAVGFLPLEYYEEAAGQISQIYPHISIVIETIPDQVKSLEFPLTHMLESSDPPDIVSFTMTTKEYTQSAEKKLLHDLQLIYESRNYDIPLNVTQFAMVGDKLLSLPYIVNPSLVYYNKQLFQEADLPEPEQGWTWEQYRSYSRTISQLDNHIVGSDFTFFYMSTFDALLNTMGAGVLSPDGQTFIGYMDSPEALRVLQWISGFAREQRELNKLFPEVQGNFIEGTLAITGGRYGSRTRTDMLPSFVGISGLPQMEQGRGYGEAEVMSYGISSTTNHFEEALAVVEKLIFDSSEQSKKYSAHFIPASRSVLADFLKGIVDPQFITAAQEVEKVRMPSMLRYPESYWMWDEKWDERFSQLLEKEAAEQEKMLHELTVDFDRAWKQWLETKEAE